MKRAIASILAAIGLSVYAVAGPIIGVTAIPCGSIAYPYLSVGWDSGSMLNTLEIGSPLYINSWYGVRIQPLWNVTPNIRVGGNICAFVYLDGFRTTNAACFIGVSGVAGWKGVMLDVAVNVPYAISPSAPFGGAWVMGGLKYHFSW